MSTHFLRKALSASLFCAGLLPVLLPALLPSAAQSRLRPYWAPAWEYVAMPDGSSSEAPVISPGPSAAHSPFPGGLRGARWMAIRPARRCLVGWRE